MKEKLEKGAEAQVNRKQRGALRRWWQRHWKWIVPVLVVCLLCVIFIGHILGGVIKTAIVMAGPKVIGAPIEVEKVFFSPFMGKIQIKNLVVRNPAQYKTDFLMKVQSVYVDYSFWSIFGEKYVVNEVQITGPEITYEMAAVSNVGAIQQNIRKFTGGDRPQPQKKKEETAATEKQQPEKKNKSVWIKHVHVEGIRAHVAVSFLGKGSATIAMSPIDMNDIGKEQKVTLAESSCIILNNICSGVADTVQGAGGTLKTGGQKVIIKLENIFSK